MTEQVGREPQYDAIADEFLRHAQDGFANAHFMAFRVVPRIG